MLGVEVRGRYTNDRDGGGETEWRCTLPRSQEGPTTSSSRSYGP